MTRRWTTPSGTSEIDRQHLYEPGPAKHALADFLSYMEADAIARGLRDVRALQADTERIAEDISAWCMEHEAEAEGLEATAHQLVNRMRCFPA